MIQSIEIHWDCPICSYTEQKSGVSKNDKQLVLSKLFTSHTQMHESLGLRDRTDTSLRKRRIKMYSGAANRSALVASGFSGATLALLVLGAVVNEKRKEIPGCVIIAAIIYFSSFAALMLLQCDLISSQYSSSGTAAQLDAEIQRKHCLKLLEGLKA